MQMKAYKFRAYPNKEQAAAMESQLETHRRLYNNALAERRDVYEQHGYSVTFGEQRTAMQEKRKACPYLTATNANACQRTLKRLDKAFQAFFRRVKSGDKPGFPRFRGAGRFDSVEFTANNGARLSTERHIYFQGVGDVKTKFHREMEGKAKTITFKREADRWFVIITCEIDAPIPEPSANPPVGIDLGLKSFLVTSEGESVDSPKFYRKAQKKLRRLQRSVSRKKKGGKNRKKSVLRLARFHAHISNQRRDFHHKTARSLVDRYGRIAHEDLNVKGMVRSLRLAKSMNDAGWSGFLNVLKLKAECAGVEVVAVDPHHTSQACSRCGGLPPESIGLKVRVYTCSHCGLVLDRDHNAAINIMARMGPTSDNLAVGRGGS